MQPKLYLFTAGWGTLRDNSEAIKAHIVSASMTNATAWAESLSEMGGVQLSGYELKRVEKKCEISVVVAP